jgi:cell division cycle 14|eukprot:CAMPEP_0185580272 /NCGR_PEP_ID=MMETSP0434-20130131/15959_1 /TAXON_ID=626734 ORGANISM="Favella taraikaensis, Strain Fe Narragansett Bay" /NCGR_SAMPLE_ID=MMETSP0434 /ASSEMBLY_ACC=CAM_ASM_000379 /LENGTH=70 /DNA_ID=CAMNT_0028198487 /DNA_START=951 /DNA_END=1163 /DNA_ORIENTATION=+
MKHFGFPPAAFIGWIRIARPGSILGPQQQYLNNMDQRMLDLGGTESRRRLMAMVNKNKMDSSEVVQANAA